jgi:dTDP-4-amino-4,6-dideoxy-D-galactose acyltransferase
MNIETEPCQYLPWDTDFFGHRIARVNGHRLDHNLVEAIYAWCEDQAIECLYFLSDSDDPQTIRLAEDHDFRLVEVRINLERSLKDWDPETRPKAAEDVCVRPVRPEDIPILQEIAGGSYIDSRFYFDKCFSQEKWQTYYETWIRKSCEGGADLALVAERYGRVVGYITGLISKNNKSEGQYELTGVDPSVRRAGVGQELFRSGLDWYVRSGVEYIWVATQGRNVTTQRMIQRHGFLTRSCQFYYHKWFSSCDVQET